MKFFYPALTLSKEISTKKNICGKPFEMYTWKKDVNADKNFININFIENESHAVIVLRFKISKFGETLAKYRG